MTGTRIVVAALVAVALAIPAGAQLTSEMGAPGTSIAPKDLVRLSGSVQKRSGEEVQGTVSATIAPGWHINSAKPLDGFVIPTKLSFDPATAHLVSAEYPQHIVRTFTFSGDGKLAVYEGTIAIPFVAKLATGASVLRASVHYQACNDSVCLPPKDVSAEFPLTAVATGTGSTPPPSSASFTPLTAAPKDAPPAVPNDRLAATFASHGLPLTLAVLFVLGMALNLTPCVFPMIPITVGFFAMQSDGRRSRRFALSAAYVAGLVITYSVLGVLAALSGKLFGAWLQNPAVLIGLALLMLVLASSMFGAWEMTVPKFIANRSMGRAGIAGAMTMGLFVGVVAAPCVGPVVVSLFTLVAAIGKASIGLVMFASLALGLGFPYLIALNALPKPGEWMVQVKKAMGFVLIAMAFYFLRSLIGEEVFRWGIAGSLLIGAAYLFLSRGTRGRTMRLVCASLLLVAGAAFAFPRKGAGVEVIWQKYDSAAITSASASHQPVLVDFFATWCIPCKELDEKTFSDPRVAAEMGRFRRIKADLTNDQDPAVQQLTRQYGIVGVPTVVLIGADGRENQALRLTGFENADSFLARLRKVR